MDLYLYDASLFSPVLPLSCTFLLFTCSDDSADIKENTVLDKPRSRNGLLTNSPETSPQRSHFLQ